MSQSNEPADFPDSRFFASHPDALHGAVAAVQLDGVFPLDWVEELNPPQARAEVMADNNTLLRALLMLDDHLSHCVAHAAAEGGEVADAKLKEASAAIARLVRS